jgi:hypothetical protein
MPKKAVMKMATVKTYEQAMKKKRAYKKEGYAVEIEKQGTKGKYFYKVYAAYLKG